MCTCPLSQKLSVLYQKLFDITRYKIQDHVDTPLSSVSRAFAYNAKGPGNENLPFI